MAVTYNPYEIQSLDFMGNEISDPRLVPNDLIEKALKRLGESCPDKKDFFDDCIEFLHQNWDALNSITFEENMSLLDSLLDKKL